LVETLKIPSQPIKNNSSYEIKYMSIEQVQDILRETKDPSKIEQMLEDEKTAGKEQT